MKARKLKRPERKGARFPAAMIAVDRWCPWRRLPDGRKFPLIPKNRPWRAFTWAEAEARRTRASGLGFQLGGGWVGLDLDDVRDPRTGEAIPEAQAVLADFHGAFVQPSVSGTGVHAVGCGPVGITGVELLFDYTPPKVILHDNSWWLAMVPGIGEGDPTFDISAPLAKWRAKSPCATAQTPQREGEQLRGFARAKDMDDDELLTAILESGQGIAFALLFRGEWRELGRYGSQSEADLALARILAWWTDYDRVRTDRLFRESKLMRPKWNDREDYRVRTLAKAGC